MKLLNLKTSRRIVQLGVALAFIALPWLNSQGFKEISGNFLFFNALGLPLGDPLAGTQVALSFWPPPAKLLQGMGIALGLALILGTVFCSWACPFGFLSELGQSLRGRLSQKENPRGPQGINGFGFKAFIVAVGLVLAALVGLPPLLNHLSLPGWYSRFFQLYFLQGYLSLAGLAILAILMVEFVFGRRLWCRYFCPQSVLLSLVQLLNPGRLRVGYDKKACTCTKNDDPCLMACSLDLNPKTLKTLLETECTNCGDCVVVCKARGRALRFGMGTGRKG